MAWTAAAQAADCPRKGTLGTSRILAVDAATTPRVGLKSFPQTLPLADHEVVLTFDDGPWPPTTPKVLAALAARMRARDVLPDRQAGFGTPGSGAEDRGRGPHHRTSHLAASQPDANQAGRDDEEIDHGISAVEMALHGVATTTPSTPFFRFPGFETTPATLDLLQSRGIVVFGADLWASDWNPMTPQQELKLLTDRLKVAGKGIILLHDPKAQTAAMLPAFLALSPGQSLSRGPSGAGRRRRRF